MGEMISADSTAARRIITAARHAREARERRDHRHVMLWRYLPTIFVAALALYAVVMALIGVRK